MQELFKKEQDERTASEQPSYPGQSSRNHYL